MLKKSVRSVQMDVLPVQRNATNMLTTNIVRNVLKLAVFVLKSAERWPFTPSIFVFQLITVFEWPQRKLN